MELQTRNGNSLFELKTSQQETTVFEAEEAQDIIYHLLEVVEELRCFIDNKQTMSNQSTKRYE